MSCVKDIVNSLLGGTDLSTVIKENPKKASEKPSVSGLSLYLMVFLS